MAGEKWGSLVPLKRDEHSGWAHLMEEGSKFVHRGREDWSEESGEQEFLDGGNSLSKSEQGSLRRDQQLDYRAQSSVLIEPGITNLNAGEARLTA